MQRSVHIMIDNLYYSSALERYLNFVFGDELCISNKTEILENSDQYYFITEKCKIDEEFLQLFIKKENRVIVLGFQNKACINYINILNFPVLASNLKDVCLKPKYESHILLYINAIRSKIELFFKGHGECSLFDGLNWTRYYLSNGPILFGEGRFSWDDYLNIYLKPGLYYWEVFDNRLIKYDIYLRSTGFANEIKLIKINVDNFQRFVDELKNLTMRKTKNIKRSRLDENINYLKKIDEILTGLKEKIDRLNHEI